MGVKILQFLEGRKKSSALDVAGPRKANDVHGDRSKSRRAPSPKVASQRNFLIPLLFSALTLRFLVRSGRVSSTGRPRRRPKVVSVSGRRGSTAVG